jgi:hypothetical protein
MMQSRTDNSDRGSHPHMRIDKGVRVREVRNFKYFTEDTVETEDEQVQESEREDFGLDTNIMQA